MSSINWSHEIQVSLTDGSSPSESSAVLSNEGFSAAPGVTQDCWFQGTSEATEGLHSLPAKEDCPLPLSWTRRSSQNTLQQANRISQILKLQFTPESSHFIKDS